VPPHDSKRERAHVSQQLTPDTAARALLLAVPVARHGLAMKSTRRVRLTLGVGLSLLIAGIGAALVHSPMSVARTNGISRDALRSISTITHDARYCQGGETLPRGTVTLRVSLAGSIGPRVRIAVLSGASTLVSGEQGAGWTGGEVTVPVKPLASSTADVTVCVSFRLRDGMLYLLGQTTPASSVARDGSRVLRGRMRVEYLRPGSRSWASLIPSTVRRMALGRATTGIWIVFVALALAVAAAILTSRLLLRDLS
jgi:hypothetical protein